METIEKMAPREIIEGLMAAAQEYHEQDALGQAVVAYNPQEDIIEPGVLLDAPESFIVLPVRGPHEPQYNIHEARKIIYPQIRNKA